MGVQLFVPRGLNGSNMRLPKQYRRTVKWLPQIGDIFPNFSAETTQGPLTFWPWAEGNWVLLFSHPAARTPVCTTELGAIATSQKDFAHLGIKVVGLTASPVAEQASWHREIEELYNTEVWFPTAADPGGELASLFGMRHAKEHWSCPIRKTCIRDPQMRIRMIFEYPCFVGRSIDETLRVVEALQLREKTGAATPADWYLGDKVIVPDDLPETAVVRNFGTNSRDVLPYLRMVQMQASSPPLADLET